MIENLHNRDYRSQSFLHKKLDDKDNKSVRLNSQYI
jgi:hypothetical protein